MSIKFVFVTANSADPDEMQCYVAFHLGFHCLPKYLFTRMKRVNNNFFFQSKMVINFLLLNEMFFLWCSYIISVSMRHFQ